VPYRTEQLARLDGILNRWAAEKGIRISAAEVIRYAVDEMLERMEAEADTVILALYHQEQREEREIPSRKFSRSRGAERYLREKKLL
jgi:Arc/MetJ-type ribon-helix-helix transcriptional regulator